MNVTQRLGDAPPRISGVGATERRAHATRGERDDSVTWLTPKEALGRLDDDAERRLLAKIGRAGARGSAA